MFKKFQGLNKGAQSLLAVATIVAGFAMMWGSTGEEHKGRTARNVVADNVLDIDPAAPDAANTGKLVVASGMLTSSETLGDEYLAPGPYLILIRDVEMFQWKQGVNRFTGRPDYELAWSDAPIDFLTFPEPTGHENPLFKITGKEQRVTTSTFGGFSGENVLSLVKAAPALELTSAMLTNPSLRIEDNRIIIPRNSGAGVIGTQLGDVRIRYRALPRGEYTVMTVQTSAVSFVGSSVSGPLVVRSGRFTSRELLSNMEDESQQTYTNLIYMGGFLFFIGLTSLITRFVPNLDLRPKVQVHGVFAAMLVSAGVSIITMLLFLALSVVG